MVALINVKSLSKDVRKITSPEISDKRHHTFLMHSSEQKCLIFIVISSALVLAASLLAIINSSMYVNTFFAGLNLVTNDQFDYYYKTSNGSSSGSSKYEQWGGIELPYPKTLIAICLSALVFSILLLVACILYALFYVFTDQDIIIQIAMGATAMSFGLFVVGCVGVSKMQVDGMSENNYLDFYVNVVNEYAGENAAEAIVNSVAHRINDEPEDGNKILFPTDMYIGILVLSLITAVIYGSFVALVFLFRYLYTKLH